MAIVLLFLSPVLKGQDTIRFRNGDIRVGKVSEVTLEEIKYLRPEAPSEPPYVIKRESIYLVKYQNGQTDSFNTKEPKKVIALSNPTDQKVISREGKIVIRKLDLIYQTEIVDDYKLMKMIEKNTGGEKRNLLMTEFEKVKKHQRMQYTYSSLGFAGMALGFVGGTAGAIVTNNGLIFAAGTAVGVGSIVTGSVLSKQFKKKRLKQRITVAQIYNDEYEFR